MARLLNIVRDAASLLTARSVARILISMVVLYISPNLSPCSVRFAAWDKRALPRTPAARAPRAQRTHTHLHTATPPHLPPGTRTALRFALFRH